MSGFCQQDQFSSDERTQHDQHPVRYDNLFNNKKSNNQYPIIYLEIQIISNGENTRAGITPKLND